jgi:hypothetical protein
MPKILFKKGNKINLGRIPGSVTRKKMRLAHLGEKSHLWKGGKKIDNGYIFLYRKTRKYISKQRVIMEQYLGRKLLKSEIVHHKNGNKLDNRIKNLKVMTRSDHAKHHYKDRKIISNGQFK